jgi:hypothetical protein
MKWGLRETEKMRERKENNKRRREKALIPTLGLRAKGVFVSELIPC